VGEAERDAGTLDRGPQPAIADEDICTLCCVCGVFLRGNPWGEFESHGYCRRCYDRALAEITEGRK